MTYSTVFGSADPSVVRNFGTVLIDYCKIVPDGIVAFFPSYLYMESIVAAWHDMVSEKLMIPSPSHHTRSLTWKLNRESSRKSGSTS